MRLEFLYRKSAWIMRAAMLWAMAMAAAPAATPDITGQWEMRFDSRSVPDAQLTPAAAKAMAAHRRKDQEGIRWCRYVGMPQQMDGPLDIRQSGNEIVLDTPMHAVARHLYTDGRKHEPADDFEPTTVGNSIARRERDVLVVETVGFSDRGLVTIPGGGFRTTKSRLTERFQLLDGGAVLSVRATWTDPAVFQKPHSYEYRYYRGQPGGNAGEWPCEPNDEARARFFAPVLAQEGK